MMPRVTLGARRDWPATTTRIAPAYSRAGAFFSRKPRALAWSDA